MVCTGFEPVIFAVKVRRDDRYSNRPCSSCGDRTRATRLRTWWTPTIRTSLNVKSIEEDW